MNINKNNYEAFFLDYYEGNLDANRISELMSFLEQNQELKEEFESYEYVSLKDFTDSVSYSSKQELKKSANAVNPANFDAIAQQAIEGTLNSLEEKELLTFTKRHPQFEKELMLYYKTKLIPDTSIIFKNKTSLKRKKESSNLWYWSAAASVALFIVSYFLFTSTKEGIRKQTAYSYNTIDPVSPSDTKKLKPDTILRFVQNSSEVSTIKKNKPGNNGSIIVQRDNQLRHSNVTEQPLNDTVQVAVNIVTKSNDSLSNKETSEERNFNAVNINNFSETTNESVTASRSIPTEQPLTFSERMTLRAKEAILKEEMKDKTYKEDKSKFTWYDAAALTCKGLSKLTGRQINFKKQYDDSEVVAYQVTAGERTYTLPVKK